VNDARSRVRETTVDQVRARLVKGDKFVLVDVREDTEYAKDHLPGAIHLGKGVIERDIENAVPDTKTEIVLYCGGGFRSAMAADNIQKMGYTNVISMDGGIREWREKNYPLTKD
jgi:rhodanese-related sulfurtransferase